MGRLVGLWSRVFALTPKQIARYLGAALLFVLLGYSQTAASTFEFPIIDTQDIVYSLPTNGSTGDSISLSISPIWRTIGKKQIKSTIRTEGQGIINHPRFLYPPGFTPFARMRFTGGGGGEPD